MNSRSTTLSGMAALILAASAGCTSSGSASVSDYNRERTTYTKAANRTAHQIADRIVAGGIACPNYSDSALQPLRLTYRRQELPIPVGSGECEGGPAKENVLIEVFNQKPPNAQTFIQRKAELLCKTGRKLGRNPDGTTDFPGFAYVMAADHSWVVEPDSDKFARQVGRVLGRPAKNGCAGFK